MLYPRDILKDVKKVLNREEFIVFTGARQTGKTSILLMLKEHQEQAGKRCFYFSLENPDYLRVLNKHPFGIFELMPEFKGRALIFIDEIQYLNDPSGFLKLLYDEERHRVKLIVSGSSAFYIDRQFKDSLAGRKFLFEVFPLNFQEFLLFNRRDDLLSKKGQKITKFYRDDLIELWERYLIYGGYPKAALAENVQMRRLILEEIGSSYVKKDITEAGIKNTDKYFTLLKILAVQSGNLVNTQELSSVLGIAHKTVEEYLYIMAKSYQAAFIRPFYENIRKELTKMPKVYFYDSGLRNFFVGSFDSIDKRQDKGIFLENIVFKETLRKAGSASKIKFWRTQDKQEVDFVVGRRAWEVKSSLTAVRKGKYAKFEKAYPKIKLGFLTYENILREFYDWRLTR